MGFSQARMLEQLAIFFSSLSSQPREQTCIFCVSCIGRQILYHQRHPGSPTWRINPLQFIFVQGTSHSNATSHGSPGAHTRSYQIPERVVLGGSAGSPPQSLFKLAHCPLLAICTPASESCKLSPKRTTIPGAEYWTSREATRPREGCSQHLGRQPAWGPGPWPTKGRQLVYLLLKDLIKMDQLESEAVAVYRWRVGWEQERLSGNEDSIRWLLPLPSLRDNISHLCLRNLAQNLFMCFSLFSR